MKKKIKTFEEHMKAKNLSDKDVYVALGMCKQTWSLIKNYENQIKADKFLEFCDLVDCSPYEVKIKNFN